MIQDLGDKKLNNAYAQRIPNPEDRIFRFDNDKILVKALPEGRLLLPEAGELGCPEAQYVFSIGEKRFFLEAPVGSALSKGVSHEDLQIPEGFSFESVRNFRRLEIKELAFAAATAYHLYQWYRDNQYCGRCGRPVKHGVRERALCCPECGNIIYPKIAPAVIVALTDGDRILLTRYNGRAYKRYALIAGFTEIGETAEETVAREVMEEVGLKVKNITYYKSQPWGTDSNLLLGFFCELDGSDGITMDEEELSTAEWFHRSEMPEEDDGFSLTREMMAVFQRGER
ncbi:NAD(+) diphosphatase [Ihubacter sp. rT4E-8]|uniref:NAD(+) diphosphatase n=1 Tax=Ihubacter sp. rT4E-8 TaxID=3242369 RepID=UPI003CF464F7